MPLDSDRHEIGHEYPQIRGITQFLGCCIDQSPRQIWLMSDIPTLRQPSEMPPVCSSEDLYQHWRALMGPLGFGQPRLWIAFLEPSAMMSAQLIQIEDIPRWSNPRFCGALLEMCGHIVGRDGVSGSVAFLLT